LAVADIHFKFDPYYVEVVEVEVINAGDFNVLPAVIDNVNGTVHINSFQLGDDNVVAEFTPVRIKMRALAETQSTQVIHPQNDFPRTILAFAGSELLTTTIPLEVVVTGTDPLSTSVENLDGLSLAVWPNPSDGISTSEFVIPKGGRTTLEIFDVSGLSVMRVFHGNIPSATSQLIDLDMNSLADGVYFLRLITEEGTLVKKIVLTR